MTEENKSEGAWIDQDNLKLQKNFIKKSREIGRSDNLYGRIDLDDQDPIRTFEDTDSDLSPTQVIEALERSPEIDVSEIRVKISGGTVTLMGCAQTAKEVRAMIKILDNLRGVEKVENQVTTADESKL